MDPTILASVIAGGAATVVAIVGYLFNWSSTRKTIEAGTANTVRALDAARDDRVWDKRAAAYEETLAGMLYRQAKQQDRMRLLRYGPDYEKGLQDFYASYDPPSWFVTQARLLAYASQEVKDAFDAAFTAEVEVRTRYEEWKEKTEHAEGLAALSALESVKSAMEDASAKDDALVAAIRAGLHGKPSKQLSLRPESPAAPAPRQ
jgi:hypothetical protein